MKKTVSYLLIIVLALTLLFAVNTVAFAADDVKMKVTVSPSSLANEGNVAITVSLKNEGDTDATDISLTYPQPTGNNISMGSLAPGASTEHKNTGWYISEDMFNKDLTFTLTYMGISTDGAPVTKTQTASVKIEKKAEDVKVSGSASVDKNAAKKDEKVKFTFKLKNEGNVKLENVKLKAPPIEDGSQIGDTFTLDPNATKTMTYSVPVVKDLEVKPVFTYTAAGKEGKTSLDTVKVKVEGSTQPSDAPSGDGGLSAVLFSDSAALGAAPGDDVVFNIDINNAGTSTISDLSAVDSAGNPVTLSSTTLKAGESATGSTTIKVSTTGNYKVDVLGKDEKGNPVSLVSNSVEIKVAEPTPSPTATMDLSKVLKLKVGVSSVSLKKAGTVDFTVSVVNQSQETLSNIVVKETTLGTIGTLAQLSAGTEETFPVKTAEITETTPFNFTASAQMPDGTLVETAITPAVEIKVESGSAGGFELNPMLLIIIIAIVVVAVVLVLYLLKQKKKGSLFGSGNKSTGTTNFKNERPKPQYASERETQRGKPRETSSTVKREAATYQDRREDLYSQKIDSRRGEQPRYNEYEDGIEQTQRVPKQKAEMYNIEPREQMQRQQAPQQPATSSAPVREPQSTQSARRPIGVTPDERPQAPTPAPPVKKDRNNF